MPYSIEKTQMRKKIILVRNCQSTYQGLPLTEFWSKNWSVYAYSAEFQVLLCSLKCRIRKSPPFVSKSNSFGNTANFPTPPHPYSKWAVFRKPLIFHAKQARFRTQQAKFHRKKLIGAQTNFGPKWPKNQGLPLGEFWWKNIRIRLCPRISLIIM